MKNTIRLLTAGVVLVLTAVGYAQPVITNQPPTQATALGTTATFTVGARGTEPLTYRWQRNLSDLAERTNATLVLSNAQLSDQADYRVVVSDSSGSVTSAVARLYVMSFASVITNTLLDNFDDNRLTGWTTYGAGTLIESNQQFTVRGHYPGQRTTATDDTFCFGAPSSSFRTLPQGQTLEWRVDLIGLDENATNSVKFLVGAPSGVYGFFKWRDFILLDKYPITIPSLFAFDKISIRNTNVILAFALTRAGQNVILTARVLEKDNPDLVLYERSVVDTPNSDPTLTTAQFEAASGLRLNFGPESSGAPYTYAGGGIGLFQYTDGTAPASTVTYDNLELRTYRVPVTSEVVITNQPQTQATAPGNTVTFTVGASALQPLAYQWQRNTAAGFMDLANKTNATLLLTNVQVWDATDYRAVISGALTSAVAHLYVMEPGPQTGHVVIDNFDDNQLTGWWLYGPGQKALFETNQQLTVWGYWPGVVTGDWGDTYDWALKTRVWSIADGQTQEWRADVVRLNEFATAAEVLVASSAQNSFYACHLGRNFVTIAKWPATHETIFLCDGVALKHTNVVLSLSLTRANPNLILTARVLDKDNQNAVLYERSVVDTPQVDRTLSPAEVLAASGMNLASGPDVSGAPYTSGDTVGLAAWQYNDGTKLAAQVTCDNLEQWTYQVPTTRYVSVASANPIAPYTNWATAARVIQDAVDVALPGDQIVVTNGVYSTGGRAVGTNLLTNRVAVDKPVTLRSVNGSQFTIIQGYQVPGTTSGDGAIRCVYLAAGASLSGFTLTSGATGTNSQSLLERQGGGVWCEAPNSEVSDCLLTANSAWSCGGGAAGGLLKNCTLNGNSAFNGGGAYRSTLSNCALTGNSAYSDGGGAFDGMLNNCTLSSNSAAGGGGACFSILKSCILTGNSAQVGGGIYDCWADDCTLAGNSARAGGGAAGSYAFGPCVMNNCIVYSNTATNEANYYEESEFGPGMNYCCTTPMPTDGVGNITNAPLFVDYAGGNLRLQSNSPCINAGSNSYLTDSDFTNCFDLDGNPRIVSGTVDIGAYEFQGPGSTISYVWLQQYGLPTDGSADALDSDADGHNAWEEWRCGTCPTNGLSALRLLSARRVGANVTVTWQSVGGVNYFLERSTNLASGSPFRLLATNLFSEDTPTAYTDTNAASLAPLFYRVGVGTSR